MPTISIFIRKEDLPKWQALQKKSEFIHNALNGEPINNVLDKMVGLGVAIEKHAPHPVKEEPQIFSRVKDYGKLCKHGNPKGSCMHKEATRLKCNA